MDSLTKICPRCRAQLRQGDGAFALVKKEGAGGSDSATRLPVVPYICPKCGYIELYDLRVTGHI